jgi:2-oxoglutarate ferredoxin oxidoreductase subunit alpha
MRVRWLIGGAQGTGVDTAANVFGAAVARAGYYLFGSREYFSNIKGRHSYFNVVISDKVQFSIDSKVDILATFDAETIFQHFDDVTGYLIYDKAQEQTGIDKIRSLEFGIAKRQAAILEKAGLGITVADVIKYLSDKGVKAVPINYGPLMKDIINQLKIDPFVAERARNMICIGASFSLLCSNLDHLSGAIEQIFAGKQKFLELNKLAATAGTNAVTNAYSLKDIKASGRRAQLDGNTISALGKLYGGLRFQSYYPITPASDESTYIEANQLVAVKSEGEKQGVIVVQTEDELAAINSAVGASLTGARSATATSGPGFSLMNEGISWAGMNEVPVLVTYYMRGSPATGLPTRSGQSDLKLALNAGHGEFARIVIASGEHAEIFNDAITAMNLAELCQTPAVHIIEKTLANSYSIMDRESFFTDARIERGKIVYPEDPENYKRFEITPDGVSPRAFLGHAQMYYTGDEHDERGHIAEDPFNRTAMYEKRIKKLKQAENYLTEKQKANIIGTGSTVLLTWGSPKGAIIDAMELLKDDGIDIEMVQVRVFSPYPSELLKKTLAGKKQIVAVENNRNAQGAEIMTEQTGIMPTNYILKWNGRPMARDELADAIKDVVRNNTKMVVLNGGK